MTLDASSVSFWMALMLLSPLTAGLMVGIFCQTLSKKLVNILTLSSVALSWGVSLLIAGKVFQAPLTTVINHNSYTWGTSGHFYFCAGFLVDTFSALLFTVVNFVSLCVHIYSTVYMKDDPGYARFMSYINLFTFAMLLLVSANNLLQLFFGWEGVGLISYLLIGFWFKKASATAGSLKAFLVNRVGDFGFLLGIAALLDQTGTLDFYKIFKAAPLLPSHEITLISLLLFIGAMGKSAQIPLHVWLPESMEGPTPISALIHAATMVTAGVYMVARFSPLFEYSSAALSVILIIGASTALFMGILALVQQDIKRIIAYSTLSQLGYMISGLGASAYTASIFHLVTHAFFKALLFLAAGSVILALHHEQDIRRMGGLKKYMPFTYGAFLVGALALSAIPPFSGFFSKDLIIDAVKSTSIEGHGYAYGCLVLGTLITPLYIFRALFKVFHGEEHFSAEKRLGLKESSKGVLWPLFLLAIPSAIAGFYGLKPLVFESLQKSPGLFVLPYHETLKNPAFHDAISMMQHALHGTVALYLSLLGIAAAYVFYSTAFSRYFLKNKFRLPRLFSVLYKIILYKYGFDLFNEKILVPLVQKLSFLSYHVGDKKMIDKGCVHRTGEGVIRLSAFSKKIQTGYLYHYTSLMIIGLLLLLIYMIYITAAVK